MGTPNNYRAAQAPKPRRGKIPSVSGLDGMRERRPDPYRISLFSASSRISSRGSRIHRLRRWKTVSSAAGRLHDHRSATPGFRT